MASEWKKHRIKDVVSFVVDNRGKTPPTQDEGHILLEVNAVSATEKFPLYREVRKHVTQEVYDTRFRKGHPKKGDILVPTVGTLGAVSLMDRDDCCIAQNLIAIRCDEEICHSHFLYYVLCNSMTRKRLLNLDIGGVQPSIKVPHLMELEIELPSIGEQKKIAELLSLLDDKIFCNKRINDNLLEHAVALYNKMCPFSVDSDLPQDWRVGTVGEIVDIHDSKRIPLSGKDRDRMENKIYPYYGAASLMDFVDNYIFDGKYLLLGEDGTVVDDKGYPILQYVWGKFWVNNHAHILTGRNGFNVESLYILFKQTSVTSIVTGAVQPKISQANLRSIKIVIPPESIIEAYNDQVEPIFSLIRTNEDFNRSLIQVRDALLPKLMSGELNVSDVEI